MKKGMKLLALAALVCAVLSCGQGIPSGGKGQTLPQEDVAVFTGNGILYYLPDINTRGTEHETFTDAQKDVTEGKAEYKNGMYISKEYALKDISFTFRKDGTYSLKRMEVYLKTNDTYPSEEKGTYLISKGQLVCTTQYSDGKPCENVYLISYNGGTLVLKSVDTPQQRSASGVRPIYTLTQSSGLLNVFSK